MHVGQQEVLQQAQRGLKAILSRRIGLSVALWGEAGIGKTHAAQALLRELPCEHLSVQATVPVTQIPDLPRPRQMPAWAVEQLDLLRAGQELSERALVDTLTTSLSALAPFVLHVEDWHDADPRRRSLLVALARAVRRTPGLGLLVTSRVQPPQPFLSYPLSRLAQPDTAALLERQLGAPLPAECVAWMHARTGGNPLFALEFLRYLTRQGALWSDGQAWHWRPPPDDFVPASVEALIAGLITAATTDPGAQAVLEARAVLPASLDTNELPRVWPQVAGCTPGQLRRFTAHLAGVGVLSGQAFAHPLFGEVVAAHLGERQVLYARRAVDALERDWPEQAAALLPQADVEAGRALAVLERAARHAQARGAQAQQAAWLARRAALTPPHERPQRALEAARALARAGLLDDALKYAEQAAATLPEAVELCAELLLAQGQAQAAEARLKALPGGLSAERWWQLSVRNLVMRGRFTEVLRQWQERPEWQAGAPVAVLRAVGSAYAYTWQVGEAEAMARELVARPDLTPEERLDARNLLGQVLNLRRAPEREDVERETIRLAREYDLPLHLGLALLNHAKTLNERPERLPVRDLLNEAAALYSRLGHTLHYARCLLRLADQAMQDGEFEDAEERLMQAHAIIRRSDNAHLLTENHLKHNRLYLTWRPPHGAPLALRHAQQALEQARASQDQKFLQLALRRVAQAEALNGHASAALHAAQEALTLAEAHDSQADLAFSWQAQGLALAAAGRIPEARARLERASDLFGSLGMPMEAHHAGLEADRLSGDIARARERRAWLLAHGHPGEASLALRFFPHLDEPPQGAQEAPGAPAAVQFRVLGPPALERSGEVVVYRARKRLELLAYLLEARLAGRAEVPALELLDAFYPDDPETRARRTLKQQVFLIRSDLGAGSVLSTPGGYALGEVQSDAESFLAGGPTTLWRGPYLDGLSDGWLAGVRDALTLALHSRAEALLDIDPAEAARLAHLLGRMEPYDTTNLHLELRALHACGQSRAAQTLYRERRLTLREVGEELPEQPPAFLTAQASAPAD